MGLPVNYARTPVNDANVRAWLRGSIDDAMCDVAHSLQSQANDTMDTDLQPEHTASLPRSYGSHFPFSISRFFSRKGSRRALISRLDHPDAAADLASRNGSLSATEDAAVSHHMSCMLPDYVAKNYSRSDVLQHMDLLKEASALKEGVPALRLDMRATDSGDSTTTGDESETDDSSIGGFSLSSVDDVSCTGIMSISFACSARVCKRSLTAAFQRTGPPVSPSLTPRAPSSKSVAGDANDLLQVLLFNSRSPSNQFCEFLLNPLKLEIGALIAVGASGEVRRGSYEGKAVAVKIMKGDTIDRHASATEFRQEVQTLISCDECPRLLEFVGVCLDTRRRMCIVTRLMEGGTLSDLVRRRHGERLPLGDALRIAHDVAEGMAFLHARGVIHRDLKSANVLLDSAGRAVVGDFGVARLKGERGDMTKEVGTYRWMAPEAFGTSAWHVTHKSDVYSFGVVLWELVACQVPFEDYTPLQAAVAVALNGLRPTIPADCPAGLRRLIERCWDKCPEARPEFDEVVKEIAALQEQFCPGTARLTVIAKANPKHQEHQQSSKKPGSTAKVASRRQTNTRVAVQGYQGGNRTEGDASSDEDAARAEDLRDALKEAQFVRWFREAWPYIQGHRGSTFVIVVPGDVVANRQIFDSILQDVALLHGLGVRIVLVPGSHVQINELLEERGVASVFHGAYRVTDTEALAAAMEASGRTRVDIEAKLSRGPVIPVLRRHGESEKWHEVGISVASGNFVHAKRRGVVGGVDYGATGEVKRVDVARIRSRLDSSCVVLLSNLGFTPAGEVLNCNTYEVATACAIGLGADKLICLLDGAVADNRGRLIRWLTLQQADVIIRNRATQSYTAADMSFEKPGPPLPTFSGGREGGDARSSRPNGAGAGGLGARESWGNGALAEAGFGEGAARGWGGNGGSGGAGRAEERRGFAVGGEERSVQRYGFLSELTAAVYACRGGVRRVHLLNSAVEGTLLLELYTRDGVGTMVSSDLYEGTRAAQVSDMPGIRALLEPLEAAGVLLPRGDEQLRRELPFFTVVERDGHTIACAALFPFPSARMAEVAAFAVSPASRGNGRGDNLLAYLEKRAMDMGMEKLFLMTTRTADWFVHRGFEPCELERLPEEKLKKVDRSRGSKSFVKDLEVSDEEDADSDDEWGDDGLPTDLPKYRLRGELAAGGSKSSVKDLEVSDEEDADSDEGDADSDEEDADSDEKWDDGGLPTDLPKHS
ncbi:unnamed protein product [Closterium sp. Yama58-4]|nr:unnamed protein product [Closterium sp. Yama58-4]